MFVRTLEELETLGRIRFPADASFRSARFLTASDGMGFSYNENKVKGGTDLVVWLKHHWEANFIVSGKGVVTDLTRQKTWALEAGVLYIVGPNDRHRLHLTEDECHVSIFCPPLTGNERFDSDGSYEPSGPIEKTDRRMFVKRVDELRGAGEETMMADGQATVIPMVTTDDSIGFGLSDVRLVAGADVTLSCEDRWQANHILSGAGEVTDLATGESRELGPSVAHGACPGEQTLIRAYADMHFLNVSCPPPEHDGPAADSLQISG